MTPERKEKMLEHLKDSQEMATSKQLWVINDLCLKYGHQYSLPLTKYEACLIVNQLKQEDELKEIQTILDDRQEIKTVEDMEWEEDIVKFTGWSMERVQEEIHEIGIETGWHEDDDRQDILESLVGKILDDAKEYLLPKYYKQWKLSQA